jgi:hypothetical protein
LGRPWHPPGTFIQRIREVVPITDLWVGLIKAPVFGSSSPSRACFQGMQVKGNSEEVGIRTTAAVVQAIFLVIVLDAVSRSSSPDRLDMSADDDHHDPGAANSFGEQVIHEASTSTSAAARSSASSAARAPASRC